MLFPLILLSETRIVYLTTTAEYIVILYIDKMYWHRSESDDHTLKLMKEREAAVVVSVSPYSYKHYTSR